MDTPADLAAESDLVAGCHEYVNSFSPGADVSSKSSV